jgi:hypothetical protein
LLFTRRQVHCSWSLNVARALPIYLWPPQPMKGAKGFCVCRDEP